MATVGIIGGGYGGAALAKALDDVAEVLLVEPRDTFVHNVAALRALVDPAWRDRLFLPYDRLLRHGRVLGERAVRVDEDGIVLGSGTRLRPDFVVLATGSGYPFPAKVDTDASAVAKERLRAGHDALVKAGRVLLLGAGPVGVELAGEIAAAWPGKPVTVVDPVPDILGGAFVPELRAELRGQLAELGVTLLLGSALRTEPPSRAGELASFTAVTDSGQEIAADLWFRCHGIRPVSDYLAGGAAAARRPDGYVTVTEHLRVVGQQRMFAIGDLVAGTEGKLARVAGQHAHLVAENIKALLNGAEPKAYEHGAMGISLPLGPRGGASYRAGVGLLGPAETARLKGSDLKIDDYAALLGRDSGAGPAGFGGAGFGGAGRRTPAT